MSTLMIVALWSGLALAALTHGYLAVQLFRKKSRDDFRWVAKSVLFRNVVVRDKVRKCFGINDRCMALIREQNPHLFKSGHGNGRSAG